MTSGDEPQLGGQHHDNSPMISGRGTKIIVSARGAYTAGNLKALIASMDEEQWLAFKLATLRQSLLVKQGRFERIPELNEPLQVITQWLANPNEVDRQHLQEWHDAVQHPYDEDRDFSFLAKAILGGDPCEAAHICLHNAVLDHFGLDNEHLAALDVYIKRWLLETGWAIVRGVSFPEFSYDMDVIDAIYADQAFWYKERNLLLLIDHLNTSQKERFKNAMLEQALWYFRQVPIHYWPETVYDWIQTVPTWSTEPDTYNPILNRAIQRQLQRSRVTTDIIILALIRLFQIRDLRHPQVAGALPMRVLRVIIHVKGFMGGYEPPFKLRLIRSDRRWQLEAAWAILHDQPLPPLE